MKRFASMLIVTLTILALPGCVQDKPAPRLESSDRNERIEAVRQAQNRYGRQAAPAETKPAQPPLAPAVMPAPPTYNGPTGEEGLALFLAIVGRWNHPWGDTVYVQFSADGTYKDVALLCTTEGTWRLLSADTIEVSYTSLFSGRTVGEVRYRTNGVTLELDQGLGWTTYTKAR